MLEDKLDSIERRYVQLEEMMGEPDIATDHRQMTEIGRGRADLTDLVEIYRAYRGTGRPFSETETIFATTAAILRWPRWCAPRSKRSRHGANNKWPRLRRLLLPKDPNDDKNVIIEIRAGAGEDESCPFANLLYGMYAHYAEKRRWKTEVLSSNPNDIGGVKELIFEVKGQGAYSQFKFESGVHRVQRVPVAKSQGRIHTSTSYCGRHA